LEDIIKQVEVEEKVKPANYDARLKAQANPTFQVFRGFPAYPQETEMEYMTRFELELQRFHTEEKSFNFTSPRFDNDNNNNAIINTNTGNTTQGLLPAPNNAESNNPTHLLPATNNDTIPKKDTASDNDAVWNMFDTNSDNTQNKSPWYKFWKIPRDTLTEDQKKLKTDVEYYHERFVMDKRPPNFEKYVNPLPEEPHPYYVEQAKKIEKIKTYGEQLKALIRDEMQIKEMQYQITQAQEQQIKLTQIAEANVEKFIEIKKGFSNYLSSKYIFGVV